MKILKLQIHADKHDLVDKPFGNIAEVPGTALCVRQ